MTDLARAIDEAFENRDQFNAESASPAVRDAVDECMAKLDDGSLRVAEPTNDGWRVNEWVKKAVLLSFKLSSNRVMPGGHSNYYDKIDVKFDGMSASEFEKIGVRVVPPATVRRGCYIAPNVILMPSYVNIGAYVDSHDQVLC